MPPFVAPNQTTPEVWIVIAVIVVLAWAGAISGRRGGATLASLVLLALGLSVFGLARGAIQEITATLLIVGAVVVAALAPKPPAKPREPLVPNGLYAGVAYQLVPPSGLFGWSNPSELKVRAIVDGVEVGFVDEATFKRFVDSLKASRAQAIGDGIVEGYDRLKATGKPT